MFEDIIKDLIEDDDIFENIITVEECEELLNFIADDMID